MTAILHADIVNRKSNDQVYGKRKLSIQVNVEAIWEV